MEPSLSVIICTRNRAAYFEKTMSSLVQQDIDPVLFEVIVIDNGSTDETQSKITSFQSQLNIKSNFEPKEGLSNARNLGIKLSSESWLVFIDDDVILPTNYLSKVYELISDRYDCFGGPYKAIYDVPKPHWLSEKFGTMPDLRPDRGEIVDGALAGGNFIVRKDLVMKVGGFDSNLGMKGLTIGYGEEDLLQLKLREHGAILAFIPDLVLHHYVLPHKFKVSWHLKSAFQHGLCKGLVYEKSYASNLVAVTRTFTSLFVLHLPKNLFQYCFKKKYYWQNLIIDTLSPSIYNLGRIRGYLKKK